MSGVILFFGLQSNFAVTNATLRKCHRYSVVQGVTLLFILYFKTLLLTITTYKQLQSGLRWSEKSQLWPKSQKDCLIRWQENKIDHFLEVTNSRKISSKYVSSKVVHHPGLRTLSVGHVDLAGCMKYIQEFYLSIQILTKKRFEFWRKKQCLWQGWISNGSFLDLR